MNGDCLFSVLVHFVLQGSSLFLFPLWLKDFRMFNIFVFPPPHLLHVIFSYMVAYFVSLSMLIPTLHFQMHAGHPIG
jgi:hypothetical protein